MTITYPDTQQQKYDRLLEWARNNGAYIHPSLKHVQTPHGGMVTIIDPKGPGIKAHEVLMHIPYSITLSYFNAVSGGKEGSCYIPRSPELPHEFIHTTADHETVCAVFLVQQYLLGEESFWYPFISTMPQPNDPQNNAIPLLWSDEELKWLQGTYLEHDIPEQRTKLVHRWSSAMTALKTAGWNVSGYTLQLGLWAYYIFLSRHFWFSDFKPYTDHLKEEYQQLGMLGSNIEDTAQILVPVKDTINHGNVARFQYHSDKYGFHMTQAFDLNPGEEVLLTYDDGVSKYNSTLLLREFGFFFPENTVLELVMPLPFDLSRPIHPKHSAFAMSTSLDWPCFTTEEVYMTYVVVRSLQDCRGPINPKHPVRALQHFHPLLVSMIAFKLANLPERSLLRQSPTNMPSDRVMVATVAFLIKHLHQVLARLDSGDANLGTPKNQRQLTMQKYRCEQRVILLEILGSMSNPLSSCLEQSSRVLADRVI